MAEPSLQLGNGNWAGKSDNLLAYHKANNNFYADELTFARASTGTIVNADGLIEQVPYNLIEQSNTFDTTWSVGNSTITGGQADKDGGTSAWVIASTTIGSETRIRQSKTFTVGEVIALSCYMKAGTVNFGIVRTYSIAGGGRVWFNLLNGTVGTENSGLTGSIESVGGGWYRCSITGVVTNTGAIDIAPAPADNDYLANAVGESIYIQDAQLDSGSTAKTYFPTTTRLNVPRVDYLNNANGSLLLEPQRTNGVVNSNVFTSWFKSGTVTVTANYGVSPTGETNSSLVNFAAASNRLYLSSGLSYANDTISIYVKGVSGETISFGKASSIGAGTLFVLTGEWQRLVIENLSSPGVNIVLGTNASATAREIEVFGVQDESGTYATSYIPTSGTTVTRLADTSATTGLSDVIGQTEGTYFVEIKLDSNLGNQTILDISDDSSSDRLGLILSSSVLTAFRLSPTDTTTAISTSTADADTTYKCAFAYSSGRHSFYVNGVQIGSDTNTITALNLFKINLGSRYNGGEVISGNVQNLQIFKTALTNTELATLTTI